MPKIQTCLSGYMNDPCSFVFLLLKLRAMPGDLKSSGASLYLEGYVKEIKLREATQRNVDNH